MSTELETIRPSTAAFTGLVAAVGIAVLIWPRAHSAASPDEAAANATPAASNMSVRFELFVEDTRKSAAFYHRVLGFEGAMDSPDYNPIQSGSVKIGICNAHKLWKGHHFSPEALAGQKGAGVEIVLEVDDLDATYKRVVENGYPIRDGLAKRPWGLRDFRIVDPDGYYLRITER